MLELHKTPKILVLGDVIVDKYIWCSCDRISPEAPVPVVLAKQKELRLGGAANVYASLKALKAQVEIIAVIGDDENKDFLKANLKGRLIIQKNHLTPLKTRIISSNQQILRLDDEKQSPSFDEQKLLKIYEERAKHFDLIILSDYAKGLISPNFCKKAIAFANKLKIPILIDPKGSDYAKYKGATLLTPNKKEAKLAGFLKDNLEEALIKMKKDLKLKYSLITLSEEGIAYYDKEAGISPTKALEVFDVTGAGDSVIAMLGFALALKIDIKRACELANASAAVVVSKIGSAIASLDDIKNYEKNAFEKKIKNKEELFFLQKSGKKIVFTNGCFDLLHYGHLNYLQRSKNLGDILIVGLNSDESVKKLKGPLRPINSEFSRSCMLAALSFVDFVVIFKEDTPSALIKAIKPDILVKGADYKGKKVAGSEYAKELAFIELKEGLSTTNLIRRINANKG